MPLKILNQKEKLEILKKLNEQFGISEISGEIIKRGEERLFLYEGSLKKEEIENLNQITSVERVGIYFAKIQNDEIRLSIDGVQIFKNQIKKNMVEIDKENAKLWMHGSEIQISTGKKGFVAIKYEEDFLGCGKASENKITNFIPKNRRLKFKEQIFKP